MFDYLFYLKRSSSSGHGICISGLDALIAIRHEAPEAQGATIRKKTGPPLLSGASKAQREIVMSKAIRAFAIVPLTLIVGGLVRVSADTQTVPEKLQPPPGEELILQVQAKGDQIYTCKTDVGGFLWLPKAPDARLFDKDGKTFGKHVGLTWEANDGSRIGGKIVNGVLSPDANSIPWLLYTVTSRSGDGVLSRVTSVQGLRTKGGKAPASCDAQHVGQELRVPYSADYLFFAPTH